MTDSSIQPPIYVILGATGAAGSSVLRQLLLKPASSIHINAYARSEAKLQQLFPNLKKHKNVSIYIGSTTVKPLSPCLKNASVIINAIGANGPSPAMRIAQDTAEAIISTLQIIKEEDPKTYKSPHLIYLSSSTLNETARAQEPWLAIKLLYTSLWYVYEDMRHATSFYRSDGVAPGLIKLSLVCPAALATGSQDTSTTAGRGAGVHLSTHKFTNMVRYPELARGMIEIADKPDQWQGKEVLLTSAQPVAVDQLAGLIFGNILPGLFITFVPALYPLFVRLGVL